MSPTPLNKPLYNRVVREAKQRFKVWPSAYASGWVVKTYKARGGKYAKPTTRSIQNGLDRWFREQWIDICQLPDIVPCGRDTSRGQSTTYPYCRPLYRINQNTPTTVFELSDPERRKRCTLKKQRPSKRVL